MSRVSVKTNLHRNDREPWPQILLATDQLQHEWQVSARYGCGSTEVLLDLVKHQASPCLANRHGRAATKVLPSLRGFLNFSSVFRRSCNYCPCKVCSNGSSRICRDLPADMVGGDSQAAARKMSNTGKNQGNNQAPSKLGAVFVALPGYGMLCKHSVRIGARTLKLLQSWPCRKLAALPLLMSSSFFFSARWQHALWRSVVSSPA